MSLCELAGEGVGAAPAPIPLPAHPAPSQVYHEVIAVLSRVAAVPAATAAAAPRSSGASAGPPIPGPLAAANATMQALAAAGGAGTGDGAVTSLDVSASQDMLVAGFYSGRVVLFDVAGNKAAVLKAAELHRVPVSAVRFVSATEPNVMSVREGRGRVVPPTVESVRA